MAVASTILSVVSGVVGAIGAIQQGNAAAASAEYNAKVDQRNQVIEDQNRGLALQQASAEADDKRRETRRLLSSMRASYGASGIELAGSPLDVLEDTAIESELDASRIEFQGRVRNREGAIKFLQLGESANLSRTQGKTAKSAATIGAVGSLVGGFSQAASKIGSGLSQTG